jgi:two-component system response regulator NreC
VAITIVLADDHAVVRLGLRAALNAERDLQVVGEVDDGLKVGAMVERLQPDVLVLDLMMPGLSGLEVTRQVRSHSPRTRVVILSMYANEAYVVEALRNGAAGYVLKGSPVTDLVEAVREVARGGRYLSPPLSERGIALYVQQIEGTPPDAYERLTTREREVLQLTAEGLTSAAIGARLFISPRTVESHRANLLRKLGLRSQTDVLRYALRRGLLPPEE